MPHNSLTDEQILLLRLAKCEPSQLKPSPSNSADIEVLEGLGYLQMRDAIAFITSSGNDLMAGVDLAWKSSARRRIGH